MKRFIVASASPRRKELLSLLGYDFEVIPSDADETLPNDISAQRAVEELSRRKAQSVFKENTDAVVLGCDTVVCLDGKILGKPQSREEAEEMLWTLSGKTHQVFSGVTIMDKTKSETFVSVSDVEFFELSQEAISSYVSTGEPMDKAGAYGIQGMGGVLVKKISGDYYTIVGLPLAESAKVLADFGIRGKILL